MPPDRPALVWTREAPTEAGWYWIRANGRRPFIVFIDVDCYGATFYPPITCASMHPGLPLMGHEWSGPIPLPKEAT